MWRRRERSIGLTLSAIGVEARGGDPARRHGVDAHAGGAHSTAAVSVKLTMPARAAPQWPMPGMPFHMSATMLTMAPPCVAHPLRVALARHQEAAGEVGATTVSKPFCEMASAAPGTGRRRC